MFRFLRKSLDWLRFPVNRDMATENSVVKVHPDTTKPNIAWDKLKVKQKVEKVTTVLPGKSDRATMFCLQKYKGLYSIDDFCINPIRRIGLIHT